MSQFLNDYSIYTPLAAIVLAIVVFLRRRRERNETGTRSLGLFIIGYLTVSVLSFIVGYIIGADIYCQNAEYAECTLGGVFVGGPISLTASAMIYSLIWALRGKHP